MSDQIEELIRSTPGLWRGTCDAGPFSTIPSGYAELDRILPGKGWPRGAVIDVLLEAIGIGELRLMVPTLRALIEERRFIVMIDAPYRPYAPVLNEFGLDLDALYLVMPEDSEEALWTAEKTLLNPACGMVLLWSGSIGGKAHGFLNDAVVRRLQVAAQASQALLLVYRIAGNARLDRQGTWAALRLGLSARDGMLCVRVLKARGGYGNGGVLLNPEAFK